MLISFERGFGIFLGQRVFGCHFFFSGDFVGWRQVLVEELLDLAFALRAHETVHRLAVLHQNAGGNAADAEGTGQFLLLVGIDLHELETTGVFDLDLLQNRAQRLARAAPRRPEIHQNGGLHRRGDDFGFKILYGDINHGKTR